MWWGRLLWIRELSLLFQSWSICPLFPGSGLGVRCGPVAYSQTVRCDDVWAGFAFLNISLEFLYTGHEPRTGMIWLSYGERSRVAVNWKYAYQKFPVILTTYVCLISLERINVFSRRKISWTYIQNIDCFETSKTVRIAWHCMQLSVPAVVAVN